MHNSTIVPEGIRADSDRSSPTESPPLLISTPGAASCVVRGITTATTLADLAELIGVDAAAMSIDGRPCDREQTVLASEVCDGSVLAADQHAPTIDDVVAEVSWIAGPDAGATTPLTAGRHVVGRATTATVCCGDPSLELHHALLIVSSDAQDVRLVQLAGRRPIAVNGVPFDGQATIGWGDQVQLGSSLLVLRRPRPITVFESSAPRSGSDPWRIPLRRTPRLRIDDAAETITLPAPPTPPARATTGVAPALIGAVCAAVIAVALDQPMLLVFAAMGACASVGVAIVQRAGAWRARRAAQRIYVDGLTAVQRALLVARATARADHDASTPTVDDAIRATTTRSRSLWRVRADHADAFRVCLGVGAVAWQPPVVGVDEHTPTEVMTLLERVACLERAPVAARLGPGAVLAVVGAVAESASTVRSLVVQLLAASGPADLRIGVVTAGDVDDWSWMAMTPHGRAANGSPLTATASGVGDLIGACENDTRHLVLIVESHELLATRTSALRRLMSTHPSLAVVVRCPALHAVPVIATSILDIGRRSASRWSPDSRAGHLGDAVHVAGISISAARRAALAIARFTDPEDDDDDHAVPAEVGLLAMLGLDGDADSIAQRIADRWRAGGPDVAALTPIGAAADGGVALDLVADGPHALIAGTTGSGKSELLRTIVVGLAARLSPDQLNVVLVDFKGGAAFDAVAALPHIVGFVTDLDDGMVQRALRSVHAELTRRERQLRDAGAIDISEFRRSRPMTSMPRLVIVIDEFAALAVRHPDVLGAVMGVAQRGRSLGVHVILATQRPSGVLSDEIRANTNIRIALRVQDGADSTDVIGSARAAGFARATPGRAIVRLGADERVVFQAARSSGPTSPAHAAGPMRLEAWSPSARGDVAAGADEVTELETLVDAVRQASVQLAVAAAEPLWMPSLQLDPPCGSPTDIGLVDDPDHRRQMPLRWDRRSHLLIVGAVGAGVTSTLLTLVASVHDRADSPDIVVVDGAGDPRWSAVATRSRRLAVVALSDHERVHRLFSSLTVELEQPRRRVLIVDGHPALRSVFAERGGDELQSLFDQVVRDGTAVGVHVVVATSQVGSVPWSTLGHFGQRWLLHVADAADAAVVGIDAAVAPPPIPGRLVDSVSGLHAQVRHPPAVDGMATVDVSERLRVEVLASHVDRRCLPRSTRAAEMIGASVGVRFDALTPAVLPWPDGEHVLVLGTARSGRSTALMTLASAWADANPTGRVIGVRTRRSSVRIGDAHADIDHALDAMRRAPDAPTLLVVDDAEMVDDERGRLAALLDGRPEWLQIAAAGRGDALRAAYGHWTAVVRRSRLGLVLGNGGELDGDLLATTLPRRMPIAARPGLGWMIADGSSALVQIAAAASPDAHARTVGRMTHVLTP